MVQHFRMPDIFNIDVNVLYKGMPATIELFDKNPDIRALYMTKTEFSILHQDVKSKTSKGMKSLIEITENGVIVSIDYASL